MVQSRVLLLWVRMVETQTITINRALLKLARSSFGSSFLTASTKNVNSFPKVRLTSPSPLQRIKQFVYYRCSYLLQSDVNPIGMRKFIQNHERFNPMSNSAEKWAYLFKIEFFLAEINNFFYHRTAERKNGSQARLSAMKTDWMEMSLFCDVAGQLHCIKVTKLFWAVT